MDDFFRLQEIEVLLQGQDKVGRIKEYFDEINVLHGAALNGMILLALCIFGLFGTLDARLAKRPTLRFLKFLIPVELVAAGLCSCVEHHIKLRSQSIYIDLPLAESVLILLGLGGFVAVSAVSKQETSKPRFMSTNPILLPQSGHGPLEETPYTRVLVVAFVLTVVSFGSWWCTEVMYDLQVINSRPALKWSPPDTGPSSQH